MEQNKKEREQWTKWEPLLDLAEKYDIYALSYTIEEGFRIWLETSSPHAKKVLVTFSQGIHAHRETDESFTLKLLHDVSEKYGRNVLGEWTFFKVANSDYTAWLSEQSYGLSDNTNFIHFAFSSANTLLEVITNYEPTVSFIENDQ